MKKYYIAIDIGGTYARIAKFYSFSKKPYFINIKTFKLTHIFEKDFNKIKEIIYEINKEKIGGIGIGIPGDLNNKKDRLIGANNIPEWVGMEIKNNLSNEFNCKVYLENDAVTSGIGEALYGNNHFDNFIYLIWGTGIGGALINKTPNIKVVKITWQKYFETFEKKCGGKSLERKYNGTLERFGKEEWSKIILDFEDEIIKLSDRLGIKHVIVGGGVALKQKRYIKIVSNRLKKNNDINIKLSTIGNNHKIGLFGAAGLIKINNHSFFKKQIKIFNL